MPHIWKLTLLCGTAYVQPLDPGVLPPAATQVALHAASELAAAAARQPIAHEGLWQALLAPWQQWPAVVHFAAQPGSAARAAPSSLSLIHI